MERFAALTGRSPRRSIEECQVQTLFIPGVSKVEEYCIIVHARDGQTAVLQEPNSCTEQAGWWHGVLANKLLVRLTDTDKAVDLTQTGTY